MSNTFQIKFGEAGALLDQKFDGLEARVTALEEGTEPAPPALSALSVADVNVNEPSGDAVFIVTLSPAAAAQVTVDYQTADGTAKAGSDYTATSGSLTFAPGDTAKQVSVPILDDADVESNETFSLSLSNVQGATITDGTAICTLTSEDVAPPTTAGQPPLAFDDPRFAGNTNRTGSINLAKNATIADTNFTGNAQTASVVFQGSGTVKNCAVKSNECIRIVGGTSNVEDCYLEAQGSGNAHADVIQFYSPGSSGVHNLKNSTLYLRPGAANCGFFVADHWSGDVNIENVVFREGLYGCRIHADDGCVVNVSMKDCYFVGPFTYGKLLIASAGGTLNITRWENVRNATIVNGQLVPGTAIARP